ncbi:MAG: phage tail tape measure protein [Methylobacteriaceae bacterium]|nr:phage tail tape measure protein [Methylobacteriaceae bacterium]
MTDDFDAGATSADLASVRLAIEGVDLSAARVSRTLARAFSDAIVQGRSFEETLKGIGLRLSSIALEAALKPAVQGLGSALSGSFAGLFGGAGGLAVPVAPFAEGGVVAAPTFFGAGGGLGLMGERGAEAIMPLARGPDGRLGVAAQSEARPVALTVNISTPDVEGFRRGQGQIEAALARAVARGRRGL